MTFLYPDHWMIRNGLQTLMLWQRSGAVWAKTTCQGAWLYGLVYGTWSLGVPGGQKGLAMKFRKIRTRSNQRCLRALSEAADQVLNAYDEKTNRYPGETVYVVRAAVSFDDGDRNRLYLPEKVSWRFD